MTAARPIPADVAARIWSRDDSLWAEGEDRPSDRLGWLDLPQAMRPHLERLAILAERVVADGYRTVALLGMGGSALAPELFASLLQAPGHPELVVFDSTHPDRVRELTYQLDVDHTLFCVASKSGTTAETLALYRLFRSLAPDRSRFLAITDPGTPLASLAEEEQFVATFLNPADVGGRFSALSLFGLVPAALIGADPEKLLDSAAEEAERTRRSDRSPGLGTRLAEAVSEGRDKLTIRTSSELGAFGDWLEQLLAESTGKHDTGVVPVVGEPVLDDYGADRLFASVTRSDDHPAESVIQRRLVADDLGAELFAWEFATAVAGVGLGINPFDQPDVESAKRAARQALDSEPAPWPDEDPEALFDGMQPPSYAAVLAFAPATASNRELLERARHRLGREHGVATVGGFGPRYLHSSGQLYKGGPKRLRALVILAEATEDLPIPGQGHTFGRLVAAQAEGDVSALRAAGQRVAAVSWDRFSNWLA